MSRRRSWWWPKACCVIDMGILGDQFFSYKLNASRVKLILGHAKRPHGWSWYSALWALGVGGDGVTHPLCNCVTALLRLSPTALKKTKSFISFQCPQIPKIWISPPRKFLDFENPKRCILKAFFPVFFYVIFLRFSFPFFIFYP